MSIGVVFAATGEKYVKEAVAGAKTVREYNPDLPICLVTDSEISPDPVFNDVVKMPVGIKAKLFKMHMDRAPYEKVLFLDTDVRVCTDLRDVFALLDRFDFAANQISSGYHYKLEGLPNTFPEYNSGVIAFRNSDKVKAVFRIWEQRYLEFEKKYDNFWDQMSLRAVLWESELRLAWLPHEYNFMPYFPGDAMTDLKIIHGRPMTLLRRTEAEMNQFNGIRAFVPGFGCIPKRDRTTLKQAAKLFWRAGTYFLRVLYARLKSSKKK